MECSETKIKVRYRETDQMGIVHHSVYAVWFELGRIEFLENKGLYYTEFERLGYYLPVIKIETSFKSSAKYGDILKLKTSIKKINRRFVDFKYELLNDDKILATGLTKHICTDKMFKPVKFIDEIYNYLK